MKHSLIHGELGGAILAALFLTTYFCTLGWAVSVDAQDPGPPAKGLPDDDGYTAVRDDVLTRLNTESKLLGECQTALRAGQDDVRRQTAVARDYERAVAELRRQKAELLEHAQALRELAATADDDGSWSWEDIDGGVGLGTGYVLGTAQCLGLAWAFNQPAFGGGGS